MLRPGNGRLCAIAALSYCAARCPSARLSAPKRAVALSVSIINRLIRQCHHRGLVLLASASTIMDLV
jgi:hypothetical protein